MKDYSKRIRIAAIENGHIDRDTEDSIKQRLVAALFTAAFAAIAALKMGRSSASLTCDPDIFSSVGMGTNSSVSKAIDRNLSNAARRLGNFLLNIRFLSSTFCSQINPWLG